MILEKVEPFIAEQLDLANLEDLLNCLIGFSHPHCTKRFALLDGVEQRLALMANEGSLSLDETAELLYELATH